MREWSLKIGQTPKSRFISCSFDSCKVCPKMLSSTHVTLKSRAFSNKIFNINININIKPLNIHHLTAISDFCKAKTSKAMVLRLRVPFAGARPFFCKRVCSGSTCNAGTWLSTDRPGKHAVDRTREARATRSCYARALGTTSSNVIDIYHTDP